jgi:hypothetical protein
MNDDLAAYASLFLSAFSAATRSPWLMNTKARKIPNTFAAP